MKKQCDMCDRPATVHLTEIVNGQKIEKHLCETCAAQEGVTVPAQNLTQILQEFVAQKQRASQASELVCEQCGLSFLEFRQNGLLGCPHDYDAFAEALGPMLERAHEGRSQHVGKVPVRAGGDERRQADLLRLRMMLKDAVLREQYEEAARLRDQIQQLETP